MHNLDDFELTPHYRHGRPLWSFELPGGDLTSKQQHAIGERMHAWYCETTRGASEHNGAPFYASNGQPYGSPERNHPSHIPVELEQRLGSQCYPFLKLPWPLLGTSWTVSRGDIAGTLPKRLATSCCTSMSMTTHGLRPLRKAWGPWQAGATAASRMLSTWEHVA